MFSNSSTLESIFKKGVHVWSSKRPLKYGRKANRRENDRCVFKYAVQLWTEPASKKKSQEIELENSKDCTTNLFPSVLILAQVANRIRNEAF